MDFSAFQALFDGFDLEKFLPELDTLFGWLELALRICVMAGPVLLLAFGLLFLLRPPKEANYALGYRFYWGMSNLEAWQFTQRLAGMAWSALGLILTVIMALICNGFRDMQLPDMTWAAVKCLGWEIGLVAVCCLAVDVVVVLCFDRHGYRREKAVKEPEE